MGRKKSLSFAALVLAAAALAYVPGIFAAQESGPGIAWRVASSNADVDQAFALARAEGKPLFLYWGAVWCPPCNQVKATLFSRHDFLEQSRAFVPVYVDGDKPGAQKVAARFKVSGYPTMVLFKPDGTEIIRLPGEVDPERYLLTLSAGLETQSPVSGLVRRALSRKPLASQEWQLLAFHSWNTDERLGFDPKTLSLHLSQLARIAPTGELRDRLTLKAVIVRAEHVQTFPDQRARASDRRFIEDLLSSPQAFMPQRDLLMLYVRELLPFVAPSAKERARLAERWNIALSTMLTNAPVSRVQALDALDSRIVLWKAATRSDQLSPGKRELVRAECLRVVSQTVDKYERQAVVPSAAHVLASAGLLSESDDLLKSELPRAVSPYYHMLVIAANAKKRGDNVEALRWYERAWRSSEGFATRLQWGATYVHELAALAPDDPERLSNAARTVVSEIEGSSETFFERNQRSLRKFAVDLMKWEGRDPRRAVIVAQVKKELLAKCERLPKGHAGKSNCENTFRKSPS